jgi:hypothetical protein
MVSPSYEARSLSPRRRGVSTPSTRVMMLDETIPVEFSDALCDGLTNGETRIEHRPLTYIPPAR